MSLLKGGEISPDTYRFVADGDQLPESDSETVIITWSRLKDDFASLKSRKGAIGVVFPVTEDPDELKPYMASLDLISLNFAAFTDGRAYSLARILRDQLKFTGELRATGDILPDQIAFMRQVGFDAFKIPSDQPSVDTWQRVATSVSLTYQRGFVPQKGFAPAEIFEQRRRRQS